MDATLPSQDYRGKVDIMNDPTLLRTQAYIDGQWVDAEDGRKLSVTNPATGEVLAEIASVGAVETRRAIEAAEAALPEWRARSAKSRAQVLRKWFDLLMENQEDLAQLMTAEQGKPLAESRGEVAYGASFLEWFAEEGKRVYGDVIPAAPAGWVLPVVFVMRFHRRLIQSDETGFVQPSRLVLQFLSEFC